MNIHILSRRTLLVVMLLASPCAAAPVPVLNIPQLVKRSDLVVVGRIASVVDAGPTTIDTPNGPLAARSMLGEIDIDQVLKGAPNAAVTRFEFPRPDLPMGYRGVERGSYRVLFLVGSSAPFRFASPYYPSVIASPGAAISAEETADQVFEAVAAVLRSGASTVADKREAINTLWGATNAPARAGLRLALRETDPSLQLNAAAALLMGNDLSGLPLATEALLQTDRPVPDEVLLSLRGAISRGVTAKEAIPSLARLQTAPDPATRRAAVTALGRTNAAEAINHVGDALDDQDFEVRLAAVRALVELTGQRERALSAEAFRADEHRFVGYWKDWLARRR